MTTNKPGTVTGWDLTVDDAAGIRDFYAAVMGWEVEAMRIEDHDDYVMKAPDGEPVAGVCHRLGALADLPAQWLTYVAVEDMAASIDKCRELGGDLVAGPIGDGPGAYCVIKDPAGAVVALMQRGD